MSKKDLIEHLRQRLSSDPRWSLRSLIRIYQNQTIDEQSKDATIERNGIGFSGVDAEILSSFARQHLRRRSLSPKQMNLLQRKIPSYARQILQCIDAARLEAARLEAAFSGPSHTQSADSRSRHSKPNPIPPCPKPDPKLRMIP
jgi:hypothetical protein